MDDYSPYITAAQRRAQAAKALKQLAREGYDLQPIEPFGGARIAKSFWGHAWCRHLESLSDYENRLPRGRSYLKNGSVAHLEITPGHVSAIVLGSERYEIDINIAPLPAQSWDLLTQRCSGKIGSLIELLQGKLSDEVMRIVTHPADGLFPRPKEIRLSCDCPDYADLCKHLAAVLYGIGRRLDDQPELLFTLRAVDQTQLITTPLPQSPTTTRRRIAPAALANVFGIDLETTPTQPDVGLDLGPDRTAKHPAHPAHPPQPTVGLDLGPDRTAPTSTPTSTPPPILQHPTQNPKPRTQNPKKITTGAQILQLRERFGMTPYEFAIIAQATSATIRNWESKGPAPLRLRPAHSATLETLAPLTPEAAWSRLDELL